MEKTYYILVADSGAAKLYRAPAGMAALELMHERSNPVGRKTRAELESDRPGTQRNTVGGTHSLGGDRNAHFAGSGVEQHQFLRHANHRHAGLVCVPV